jgi:hypothetical protein
MCTSHVDVYADGFVPETNIPIFLAVRFWTGSSGGLLHAKLQITSYINYARDLQVKKEKRGYICIFICVYVACIYENVKMVPSLLFHGVG